MKKILVPVDFSDVSRYAAAFAVDLAENFGAHIVFLHSMHVNYFNDFPHATSANLQFIMEDIRKAALDKMEKVLSDLQTNATVETRISNLHLLDAVRDTVKDEEIGLVIVGTTGSSGWSEFLIGSNTERIVRWVDCPVIAVPSETSYDSIKKILVPINLREIQDEFMHRLVRLQKLFSASMEFLWVKTPHNIENDPRVIEEFSHMTKEYGFRNATFTIAHNVFPSDGILEHAKDTNADMIAMATHARRHIAHWLSGSITEDTINHIQIPVWSFKLNKKAKNRELLSIKQAKGTPEYKKIKTMKL